MINYSIITPKNELLYHYFLKHGFDCTIEQIADSLHVAKKTLFNRYENRNNMIMIAKSFWETLFMQRYDEKAQYFNQCIERLLLLIYELSQSKKLESPFFDNEFMELPRQGLKDDNPFIEKIGSLIEEGRVSSLIKKDFDQIKYCNYLLFNIVFLFIHNKNDIDYLDYMITPALTTLGMERYNEINISSFFK